MKRCVVFLSLMIVVGNALADFHMGLGRAVAKEGSNVLKKIPPRNVGDAVAQTLPSCGATMPYTVPVVSTSDIQGIDPLGHVNPPGHTLPSDHIYFYIRPIDPMVPYGTRVMTSVLAPGDVHITRIISSIVNGNSSTTDYGIEFWACREVKAYFGHVKTLSSQMLTELNNAPQYCTDYATGGNNFHRCEAETNISVSAGDLLGQVGGTTVALDFGSYDFRQSPLAFISPSRHYANQAYTVCPIDYYDASLKAILENDLGRWDGGHARTALPLCGEILYDTPSTAMGNWYHIGSPDNPEDPHLALIKDNVYNPRQEISVGTYGPGFGPQFYIFDPLGSGTHNRDFSHVTADSQVYCYDSFYDPLGQPLSVGFSVLISLTNSTTLRLGKLNASSCGAGPWSFTSYSDYQR